MKEVEQKFGRGAQLERITKLVLMAAVVCALAITCSKDKDKSRNDEKNDEKEQSVAVTSVSVEPAAKTLNIDDKFTPVATVEPGTATNKAVAWTSDKPAIATVNSETGEVTAVSAGDAVITATAKDGSTKSGTVAVKVNPAATVTSFVAVTGITLTSVTTFVAGTPLTLAANVAPGTATNKTVVWSVKRMSVKSMFASISNGVLTASAAGIVTVAATIANGATENTDYTQEFDIEVTADFVAVTGVTLASTTYEANTLSVLFATVAPANATNDNIVWSIKDAGETGASFGKGGRFSASAAGTVILTATIENGLTESTDYTQDIEITIIEPYVAVTSITLTSDNSMTTGKKFLALTATVAPATATNKTIVWSIKDDGGTGAYFDEVTRNRLRATAAGTVIVTATVAKGATESTPFKQEFSITVTEP